MRRVSTVQEECRRIFGVQPKRKPGSRTPSADERSSWFDSATKRRPPAPYIEDIRGYLSSMHPLRMKRIARDQAWLKKELKRLGRNPEDFRWL